MMGILLDQLTSGMSFFSASPVDELADCALSTTRSELAGSVEGESTRGKGFDSFNDAKKFLGSRGEGNQWHHIVEQSQIQKSGFISQVIQNTDNLIAVDKVTHAKISGYYNTKSFDFTGGLSVRNWLAGQSYETQWNFGMNVLKQFGVTK